MSSIDEYYILIRVLQKSYVNHGFTIIYQYLAKQIVCKLDIRSLDPSCTLVLNISSSAFLQDKGLILWWLISDHFVFKVIVQEWV